MRQGKWNQCNLNTPITQSFMAISSVFPFSYGPWFRVLCFSVFDWFLQVKIQDFGWMPSVCGWLFDCLIFGMGYLVGHRKPFISGCFQKGLVRGASMLKTWDGSL